MIDLKGGEVVRAVRGERSAYRPVVSGLCRGSDPVPVARALLEYCASPLLYVADLDALSGGEAQTSILAALLEALPAHSIWLDAGFADALAWSRLKSLIGPASTRLTPVFASEALASPSAARDALADPLAAILSLDRRAGVRLDRAACWSDAALWPQRLILMSLERVGAFEGPDLDGLAELRAGRPGLTLIGAGGIRDHADLLNAAAAGASAWLVASALHDRRIPAACPAVPLAASAG